METHSRRSVTARWEANLTFWRRLTGRNKYKCSLQQIHSLHSIWGQTNLEPPIYTKRRSATSQQCVCMFVCVCVLSVRVCVCPHVKRVKAVWSKCLLLYKILTELVVFFWLSFRLKVRNYLTDAALPTEQGRWDNLWAFYFSLCWKFCCDFSPISAAVMFSGILWWLYLVKKKTKKKNNRKHPI